MTNSIPTKYLLIQWIKVAWGDGFKPYQFNRWFQLGIVFLLASAVKVYDFHARGSDFDDYGWAMGLFILAALIIGVTQVGRGTLNSYKSAKKMISRHGELKVDIQEKIAKKLYCFRAGVRAAAVELRVEKQLIPSLANGWKLW